MNDAPRPLRAVAALLASSLSSALAALARQKAVALVLRTAGTGQLGLLTTSQALATSLFGFGLHQSAVREISAAPQPAAPWAATAWLHSLLAVTGGVAVYAAAAAGVWGHTASQSQALALALTVALGVHAQAPMVLLTATQRLRLLARLQAGGAALGTAVSLLVLWQRPDVALPALLVAPVAATWALAWWGVRHDVRAPLALARPHLRPMLLLGATVAFTALLPAGAQWALREVVLDALGLDSVGLLHASFAVSSFYLSFLLSSLAAEFYPRLVRLRADAQQLAMALNEQLRLLLVAATPVVMLGVLLAPWALTVLFSGAFEGATQALRLQLLGDVPKLAAWPLAYVLMACDRRRAMVFVEALWLVACVALTAALVRTLGLEATGVAYTAAYWLYLAALVWLVTARTTWRPGREALREFILAVSASAVTLAATRAGLWAMVPAGALALALGARAFFIVRAAWRKEAPPEQ